MTLPPARLLVVQTLVAVAVLGGIVIAYGGWQGFALHFDEACPEPVCDFTRHYAPVADGVPSGTMPGWGYVYPPTLAILVYPLRLVPGSEGLWAVLLAVVQVALAVLPTALLGERRWGPAVGLTALSAGAIAGLQVLSWGQVSGLLVLLLLVGFFLLRRQPWLAGGLVGATIALKVYPVVVVPWLLWRRSWRSLLVVGLAVVVLGGVLPVLVYGVEGTLSFYSAAWTELQRLVPGFRRSIGPQSVASVASRLGLHAVPYGPEAMTGIAAVVGLAQLGLVGLLERRPAAERWLWALVLTYGVFPCFLASSWLHYFVHLPLAWVLLARVLLDEAPTHRVGIGIMTAVSVLAGTWPAWVLLGDRVYVGVGVLLGSHLAALTALVFVLLDSPSVAEPSTPVDTPAASR